MEDQDLLQWLKENDKIEYGKAIQQLKMIKDQKYLQMHKYKITEGKDGKWHTHYYGLDGKRHPILKNTREEVEQKLIEIYRRKSGIRYFPDIFESWIQEKLKYGEICEATYAKYRNSYTRFFKSEEPIMQIPVDEITVRDLELFIKGCIQKYELTTKGYADLRTVIIGPIKHAVRDGLMEFNIKEFFDMIVLPKRIFKRKTKKNAREEVFLPEEAKKLIKYFWEQNDMRGLGLILMFQTGMRVGEMCTLKWSDVSGDTISVERTETYTMDPVTGKKHFKVGDMPKTEKGERIIILPEQGKKTLSAVRRLNPFGEFMFMDSNEERINSKRFNVYLKNSCKKVGIPPRTTHKIRKTYASMLLRNKVDEALVADQMGHTNITTTRQYYYYNTADEKAIKDTITEAISF